MRGYDVKFLDELKSKNDIVTVVSSYVQLEQRGSNFWGRCPFHHEKTASFCVNGVDNFYYCFGCHKSGDVISFIMEMESLDFGDAVKFLANRAGMEIPEMHENSESIKKAKEKKEKLLSILKDTALFYVANLKNEKALPHLEYLARRGVDGATLRKFGIGVSLDFESLPKFLQQKGYSLQDCFDAGVIGNKNNRYFDALGGRLIIPVINQMNQVVAFCGRILESKGFAKYVNTKETAVFNKGNTLFNINNLKKLKNEKGLKNVIIVEGHMDVISLVAGGFENVVASMGTSLTKDQARILKRYSENVLISYDGDFAGQKASIRGLEILKDEGLNVKVVSLPDGMDPDDVVKKLGADAYSKLLDSAMPLIDFKLQILKNTFDITKAEGKRKYITEAIKVVKQSPSPAEQEDLLKEIRSITGITYESLRRELDSVEEPKQVTAQPVAVEAKEKTIQAERFVLASILFSKKYALDTDIESFDFQGTHAEIADYIKECKKEGKEIKPNLLYDVIDEDGKGELASVLALELTKDGTFDEQKYFKDCVLTLRRVRLEKDVDALTELCDTEKNIESRRAYTVKLMEKIAELNRLT